MLSSVLFLNEASEAACWGPTLVVDQTPRLALGQRAWLAPAICNCLVSFPGNLLHGVLPGAPISGRQQAATTMIWSVRSINPTMCFSLRVFLAACCPPCCQARSLSSCRWGIVPFCGPVMPVSIKQSQLLASLYWTCPFNPGVQYDGKVHQRPSCGLSGSCEEGPLLTSARLLPGCGEGAAQRVSLVVAWWPPGTQPQPGAPGMGPARSLPRRPPRGSAARAWLAAFRWEPGSCADGRMSGQGAFAPGAEGRTDTGDVGMHDSDLARAALVPPLVRPAWQPVGAGQDSGNRDLPKPGGADWAACALPSLRFFLRCECEIARTYVPEESA